MKMAMRLNEKHLTMVSPVGPPKQINTMVQVYSPYVSLVKCERALVLLPIHYRQQHEIRSQLAIDE